MDKYLTASILIILARKAEMETRKMFLQNRFGLYDTKNHIIKSTNTFKIRLKNSSANVEPNAVGATDEANTNAFLGYEEVSCTAPRYREKKPINPTEILNSVSDNKSTQSKEVMELLKAESVDLLEIPNFGHELLVAKALQNTTLSYKVKSGGSTNTETIDLKSPAGHIVDYSVSDTNKKVTEAVKEGQSLLRKKKYKADTLILGSNMVDKFIAEVGTKLSQLHTQGIVQKLNGLEIGGYRLLGTYDGMEVYEYEESYDVGGTDTPVIGVNNVIVTSTQMKWKKYFGAILDSDAIKENKHIGKVYSKSWTEKDPSVTWLLIETNSIPVPTDAGGIYCATLATPA